MPRRERYSMFRIGLVGAGAISRRHLQAFVESDYVATVEIADPSEQAREAMRKDYGLVTAAHETIEPLLENPDIAIIDVCTPHYLHKPQAIAALEAGKHVILEKPMAMTVAECDEILAAAERSGKRVFVALCQRMFPAHLEAKRLHFIPADEEAAWYHKENSGR